MLGRNKELQGLSTWLDGIESASGTMVIDGPAGIGKSAMLDAARRAALERGWRILAARPTEPESVLAFSVLGDLLRDLDLGVLGEAHRRAIEVALGSRTSDGEPPSAAHLGVGLMQLLQSLARPANVLVAVDDLQWADTATREVLQFVLRRLPAIGIGVIVGVRTGPSSEVEVPEGDRISLVQLGDAAAAQLIRDSSTTALPLDVVRRLVAGSGGNPLFAVELGRSMTTSMLRPGRPVPVPASLQTAIARRFASMSEATMVALAAVAMLARPTLDELAALGMVGDLLQAEEAAIISVTDLAVTFVHPLFASVALPGISGEVQPRHARRQSRRHRQRGVGGAGDVRGGPRRADPMDRAAWCRPARRCCDGPGRRDTAVHYLARYDEVGESMRVGEPGYLRLHGDFVEALVAVGDIGQANSVLDRLEDRGQRTGRVSALAIVDRGRALVSAHAGDGETAFASAHRALERLLETPLAYDRARAHLTLGVIARRFRRRAVARTALEQALPAFECMGAISLSERARRELQRVGGAHVAAAADALTPTEAQVARLVGEGATNREVADALFINVKTVEANLTRVYRKLQMTNRAQLAARRWNGF